VKEKEQHIEQLLLERDLERSEVAKSSIKLEDVRMCISFHLSTVSFCPIFTEIMCKDFSASASWSKLNKN